MSFASCSYSLRRPDLILGSQADRALSGQRVFLPVVDNLSPRTGIEGMVTNSIRESFSSQKDVELVNEIDDADFKMLVSILDYSSRYGVVSRRGDSGSAQAGGIGDRQTMAANVLVNLKIHVRLFERIKESPEIYRVLWTKEFERSGSYETSDRYTDERGSSTAPYINASRELIQVKTLSTALGQDILDHIGQNF